MVKVKFENQRYETQSLKSSHQPLVPSAVQTAAAAGRC